MGLDDEEKVALPSSFESVAAPLARHGRHLCAALPLCDGVAVDNEGIACKLVAGAQINTVQLTCGPLFNENLERALSVSMCLWGYL